MSDKAVFRIIMIISVVVCLAVIILNKKILPAPAIMPHFVSFLPMLNAFLNGTCSLLLLISLYFIKKKKIAIHKKINILAFVLSSGFLISYIMYHWLAQETSFPHDNPLRTLYLVILISHIILAAIVLPLVLLSFYYGLLTQGEDGAVYITKHRRLTRWSFPIWLYVTVTGVVVYMMISPYYSF
jgi:putative membrane protein